MNRTYAGLAAAGILGLFVLSATPALAQKEGGKAPQVKEKSDKPQGGGKKDRPEQSAVAAKKEFGTAKEKDASVSKALDAAKLADLKNLDGKDATFKGTVAKVFVARGNSMVILNFAKDYKTAATAVLRPADYDKFPDLKKLDGKKIVVTGKVELYKDQPEIVLTKPEQIKVIK